MGPRVREDDIECSAAACENFKFQTAKLSHSRGAKRPRFASPSRTARGDGAVGGARMLARHPWRRDQWTHLARQGTARAQGKAQRLPALHRPPVHRPFRGAPVRPAFALSAERIAPRKRPLTGQDASRIREVLGTGIRNEKFNVDERKIFVVPANAGTHTHRCRCGYLSLGDTITQMDGSESMGPRFREDDSEDVAPPSRRRHT
jgi:hypothetical protein